MADPAPAAVAAAGDAPVLKKKRSPNRLVVEEALNEDVTSTKSGRTPSAAHLGVPRSAGGVNHMAAAHAGAPQVFALDGAFPSADGILKKSKREGLFRSTEPIVARWNGKSFSSVNTMPDGACGAHAQYGRPAAGVLA